MKRGRRRPRVQKSAYGTRAVILTNLPQVPRLHDLYHWLLTTNRASFGATILCAYLGANTLFALAYMACGGIENVRPGSFLDAFFFSVQTMATIGYGRMVPISTAANLLVTAEAGIGIFGIAVAASLLFARFTRPTAGVRFSSHAVVARFDGKPTLMFRLANERVARINAANVYLVLARQEVTAEGQTIRRLRDLESIRSFTPVFELSWTVMHVIDEKSPLFGCTPQSLADSETSLAVVFTGHHEGFQQQVHARHTYDYERITWDHRFADLITRGEDGQVTVDYSHFDELVPVAKADCLVTKRK
jgi:inward rectifier potassium channel